MLLFMRTTLEIDDDVLHLAKALAAERKTSAGSVISELARKALTSTSKKATAARNGLRIINRGAGAKPVTLEIVNALRDEAP